MSEKFFNYMAWGAAHFHKHDLLSKVLYQAAILDYSIDMQTYLKCQLSIYYQDANPLPLTKEKDASTSSKPKTNNDTAPENNPSKSIEVDESTSDAKSYKDAAPNEPTVTLKNT